MLRPTGTGTVKNRVSESAGHEMLNSGGIGYIARRGYSNNSINLISTAEGIASLALSNPLELLCMLPDLVTEPSKAMWDLKRLANAPKSSRLKAVIRTKPTPEEIATDESLARLKPDASGRYPAREAVDGTAIIEEFFKNTPKELGGYSGIVSQNLEMVALTGMSAGEFVPLAGKNQKGEFWPIHPLTLLMKRDSKGYIALEQKQTTFKTTGTTGKGKRRKSQYVPLPMERTFYHAFDSTPGNPYGRPPFGPALAEILMNLAFIRDILLSFHRVGTPFTDVEFDFELWTRLAPMLGGVDAEDSNAVFAWVRSQFEAAKTEYAKKKADSAYFHDKGSKVNIVGSSGQFSDVAELYNIFRWRLVIALKSLPALFGISEGQTETWATVEYKVFTSSIESILLSAISPVVQCMESLLQDFYGLPYEVEVEIEPIRTSERLVDAQAEEIEIRNEVMKRDEGWQTNDESAMNITGSPAISEPEGDDEEFPPGGNDNTEEDSNEGNRNERRNMKEPANVFLKRYRAERAERARYYRVKGGIEEPTDEEDDTE